MIKIVLSNYRLFSTLSRLKGIRHFVSFDLQNLDKVVDNKLFSLIIDEIKLPNGSFKTTSPGRFTDIDDELIKFCSVGTTYEIHDIAASDGITSLELYKLLTRHKIQFRLTISDKYSFIYSQEKWWGSKYYNIRGEFIFADLLFIRACSYLSRRYLVSRILGRVLHDLDSGLRGGKKVLLLNPKVNKLIESKEICFVEYDLFGNTVSPKKYDIIRCMNILNPRYFDEETLKIGINNLKNTLKQHGIVLIGRTDIKPGVNNVSFYKKKGNDLVETRVLNTGSEIAKIINV